MGLGGLDVGEGLGGFEPMSVWMETKMADH
jgi:hypothetical protein